MHNPCIIIAISAENLLKISYSTQLNHCSYTFLPKKKKQSICNTVRPQLSRGVRWWSHGLKPLAFFFLQHAMNLLFLLLQEGRCITFNFFSPWPATKAGRKSRNISRARVSFASPLGNSPSSRDARDNTSSRGTSHANYLLSLNFNSAGRVLGEVDSEAH